MHCHLIGIGVWGPGLHGWPVARQVLRGEGPWPADDGERPAAAALPPAERRRATPATRVAITVASEAIAAAGIDAAGVPSVFASSASNPDIIDEMCAVLAGGSQTLSPTKFHNSVHNSPAGYFSIAVGSRQASTSLCAFDSSAAAGLLEAGLQSVRGDRPVVLVSCDLPYPGPLGLTRIVRDVWGVALVLSSHAPRARADGGEATLRQEGAATTPAGAVGGVDGARGMVDPGPGSVRLTLAHGPRRPQTTLDDARLETARLGNPTARLLPLLQAIACREDAEILLDMGLDGTLSVRVDCGR